MAIIAFDVAVFRRDFPEFADDVKYPDETLQAYFNTATCYISANDCGPLTGDCRLLALNAMTAHLCKVSAMAVSGQTPGVVSSSTVGSVSVSLSPPPFGTDQWSWWLSTTPYGLQLQALLSGASVGGFIVGGSAERSAFRSLGGQFLG